MKIFAKAELDKALGRWDGYINDMDGLDEAYKSACKNYPILLGAIANIQSQIFITKKERELSYKTSVTLRINKVDVVTPIDADVLISLLENVVSTYEDLKREHEEIMTLYPEQLKSIEEKHKTNIPK